MPSDREKVELLISTGSEIAGAATGAAIGFLAGGPAGAAVGGASGVIISKGTRLLSDIADRFLSKREKIRVGATAAFALAKIKSHLHAGFKVRNDGFFADKEEKRSGAEEIFEGVLLKAKNEHEEKKAKILGNIFANIAFLQGFSVGEANHLLQIAQNLTYRGMCVLSLIKRKDQIQDVKLREESYLEFKGERIFYETISTLQEAYQIYNSGLIACKQKSSEGYLAMVGWTDLAPNRSLLTPMGERYYEVMGLEDIPEEDIKEVAKYLS
ncbi:MAG: hypothetical protein AAGB97_03340 [Dehalococcoidia bacterium]